MKKTTNRRVIVISDLKSGYFEQAVFYIRQNVTSEEDILLKEANRIVSEFSKNYRLCKNTLNKEQKNTAYKITAALTVLVILFITLYCTFQ